MAAKHPCAVRRAGAHRRRDEIMVNSLHGQAIDRPAPGLVVEAVAPDGTIEAVRVAPARGWACGVQWHPEWGFARQPGEPGDLPARSARRAGLIGSGHEQEGGMTMDLQLAGKRALITGGSKGIGRASAEVLADEGCDVILVARDAAALDAAAAAIRARRQVNVRTISADLSSDAAVRKVAAEAGEIDILVNNAGAIPPGDLLAVDDETWRRAWDLKVFGYISLCRAVYPAMKARGAGVIVNVIGAAGEKFPPAYIAGAAGNASLMAFTRALGKRRAGRRAARGGDQSGPGGDRAAGDAAARQRREDAGRSGAVAGADQGHAVRPAGQAGGDRLCGGVPGQRAVGLHVGHGADDRWRGVTVAGGAEGQR